MKESKYPKTTPQAKSDLFVSLGYTNIYSMPISIIDKDYSWGQIKLPEGWKIITPLDEDE